MAQTGYTPILIYGSSTAAATPTAGNLTTGASGVELALNYTDGKLYFKNNSGVVTLLASSAGASGDVVGPASATDNAVARFDLTTGKLIQNSVVIIGDTGDVTGVGALSASGNVTLSGGTANGVTYLNGSKVLTSGSALTFDGTTLANINSDGTGFSTQSAASNFSILRLGTDSVNGYAFFQSGKSGTGTTLPFAWRQDSSELMRLTSTGLGIGTSSPAVRLDVQAARATSRVTSTTGTNAVDFQTVNTGGQLLLGIDNSAGSSLFGVGAYAAGLWYTGAYPLVFGTNNTERMRISADGNLGLGVTPSADWASSSYKAFVVRTSFLAGSTAPGVMALGNNAYNDGAGWKYVATGVASYYVQNAGAHSWSYAASGTAGNAISFTQAMTLDSSGRLGLITTSPGSFDGVANQFVIGAAAGNVGMTIAAGTSGASSIYFADGTSGGAQYAGYIDYQHSGDYMRFGTGGGTERARITSGGDLLVNTTSAVSGSKLVVASADATIYGITVGRGAGAESGSTVVGSGALAGSNTGANNTAIGRLALAGNTSGAQNNALGYAALTTNTTGTDNTAVGHLALYLNTTGGQNAAFGREALRSNTTASNNTAVGYQAGYSNTTGTGGVSLGYQAGYANTTSDYNTAVGNIALRFNTGGSNSAVGYAALYNNTTGGSNTALGFQSLVSNTTASNNTAVGYQAGYSNTTGSVTAFGQRALYANTTGADSVAMGIQALVANTTGNFNTAIGHTALTSNTTASNNTAIGFRAGYLTTGQGNTFVGRDVGYNTTGASNTFIGYNDSAGYGSGQLVTTGTKNTILGPYNGNQGGLDIRTASNYIVLSDGDGNPKAWWDAGYNCKIRMGSGAGTNTMKYNTSTYEVTYDTSSARYKDNIRDSVYGLSHVMQMRSAQFEYKDGGRTDIGLIAEELDPIIPELVGKDADGRPDSVTYDRMVSVLVKAIQELKSELDSVKAELATLKGA